MLQVRPLSPAIGAELVGVDLTTPLDAATVADIESALLEHLVVFFRDQEVDDLQLRAFAARFGPLQRFPFGAPVVEEVPEVHAITTGGPEPVPANADIWHSDATFMACPPMGTVLRAVELPSIGGDTLFANMYAAYESLSSRMQRLIDGMSATHDFTKSSSHRRPLHSEYPPVQHPVVRTHPLTGRKALFVNRIFTVRLDDVSDRENEVLLPLLADHAAAPDLQCRFTWTTDAIAFWDNRCTQHYAVADYRDRRVMHRIVIDGDRPR